MALDRMLGGSGSVRSPGLCPPPQSSVSGRLPLRRRGALGPRVLGRGRPAPVLRAPQPSLLAAPGGRVPAPFSQHVCVYVLLPALCNIYCVKGGTGGLSCPGRCAVPSSGLPALLTGGGVCF